MTYKEIDAMILEIAEKIKEKYEVDLRYLSFDELVALEVELKKIIEMSKEIV